ncbi:MAG: hypothetical protein WKF36_04140 [Candidatus Nitrosocosmicus sp.]
MGELKTRKEIEMTCLNSIFRLGKKRRRQNTLLPLLLSFLVFASLVTTDIHINPCCNNISPYAHGQQTEKDPAFQDSYWTDKTVASGNNSDKLQEREVGPGEGIATLAVVLVNKAQSEITAVKGYLNLPQEFQAVKTRNFSVPIPPTNSDSSSNPNSNSNSTNGITSESNALANNIPTTAGVSGSSQPNIAAASYDSIIAPGEEFTLYFDINILNSADLGLYIGSLDLVYSKVLTPGDTVVRDISIPFRIPGKVILDVELQDQYLTPAQLNKVNISIINKGSADANSAIVTISNANGNAEDGLTTISSSVEDSEPAVISDTANDTASSATSAPSGNSSSSSTTKEQQANRNTTSSSSLATIGTQRFDVGKIGAGETVSIAPLIYPSLTASETLQSMNVEISYGNQIGNRENVDSNLGIVISAQPTESNFDGYFGSVDSERVIGANVNGENGSQNANNVLTAGEIEEVEFTIEKTTPSTVDDAIVSITPSSDSVKVLGSSRWSFETIENSTVDLKTDAFASEDLIGKPIQFNVDIDYILNGISKSESLSMGMYVDGKIAISAYDFGVSIIGDDPNLVTNLLNEGNMDALFTTVELIPPFTQDPNGTGKIGSSIPSLVQRYPPLQYVGDLAENSPLPISIPVDIPNGTKAGDYPVFMKVSYKDNLRDNHELVVNGTVEYTPEVDESAAGSGGFFGTGISSQTVLPVVAAFAIVVVLLIIRSIRKKRKTKKLRSLSNDKDSKDELDSLLKK